MIKINKRNVLIVAKTKMKNNSCVGGVLENGRLVRLLKSNGFNQDLDTDFEVGDIYSIDFVEREDKVPPHIEDIFVLSHSFEGTTENIVHRIKNVLPVKIVEGHPKKLFEGRLNRTSSGSCYIDNGRSLPSNSVGFWIPRKDLEKYEYNGKVRYEYPPYTYVETIGGIDYPIKNAGINISFVGYQKPVDVIPAGTLVRVSLARWWDQNGSTEERCYLQLSGWYGLPEAPTELDSNFDDMDDDLPF